MHALYDFLLDLRNTFTPNQGIDLPRLIATTAFPHASLKRAQTMFNTQVGTGTKSISSAFLMGGVVTDDICCICRYSA